MHRARGALRVLKAVSKPVEAAAEQPSLLQLLHRRYSILSNSFRGEAGEVSRDAGRQAEQLRQWNRAGNSEAVVSAFESGRVANTEEAMGEYVKALVRLDRLDNTRLLSTLQRGANGSFNPAAAAAAQRAPPEAYGPPAAAAAAPWYAASMPAFMGGGAAAGHGLGGGAAAALGGAALAAAGDGGAVGTNRNPLVITHAEPSVTGQFMRLLRSLGLAFVLVTAAGAFLDEKTLGKGLVNSPELKPMTESKTKFDDVKGVDEAKYELEEIVEYLKAPEKFTKLGGKLPKGVLLVGPPGTGKTMLARAIAGEAKVPFFYTSGSEFEEVFVGVGARRVRDLFAAAKKHAPCIIFIDEIDAIGGNRSPKDQMHLRMTLNQLLVEMDGFKPSEGVIVVAATNFPEILDKALIRPGRFDRHVVVPAPDVEGRRQILEDKFKNVPIAEKVDLMVVARGTPGFSGADLTNLVNVAALHAAKAGQSAVGMDSLEYARDRIMMGAERKSAVITDKSRRLTAYHEGGHALMALFTEGADPVHKATIVPRGMALGMVTQLPEEDHTSMSRKQMMARLDVLMGGRVAEELIFGEDDVTSGASSDLKQATHLARAMVTKYGMSSSVGQVSLDYEDDGRSISSETRALIEKEVRELVQGAYARAKHILTTHEPELHAVAAELLDKETMSGEQIQDVLNSVKQGLWKGAGGMVSAVTKGAEGVAAQAKKGAAAAAAAAGGRKGIA